MSKRLSARERFDSKWEPEPTTGCWLWTAGPCAGYGYMCVSGRRRLAHRLAWEYYRGPVPQLLHVLHHCDTPGCVNPVHLFLGTNQDNVNDRNQKGRQAFGPRNGRARLTSAQIRDVLSSTESQRKIAARLGVAKGTVQSILERKSWRHVEI